MIYDFELENQILNGKERSLAVGVGSNVVRAGAVGEPNDGDVTDGEATASISNTSSNPNTVNEPLNQVISLYISTKRHRKYPIFHTKHHHSFSLNPLRTKYPEKQIKKNRKNYKNYCWKCHFDSFIRNKATIQSPCVT